MQAPWAAPACVFCAALRRSIHVSSALGISSETPLRSASDCSRYIARSSGIAPPFCASSAVMPALSSTWLICAACSKASSERNVPFFSRTYFALLAIRRIGRVQIRLRQPAEIGVNEQLRALPAHAEGHRAAGLHIHARQPVGNHHFARVFQLMQARRQQLVAGVVLPVKGILPFRLFLRKNLLYARKQLILAERVPADMRRILAGMHPRRAIQPFRTAQQRVFLAAVDVKARRHLHRGVLLHQLTPPDHRRARGRNDLRTDGRNLLFRNDEAVRRSAALFSSAAIRRKSASNAQTIPLGRNSYAPTEPSATLCALTRSRAPSPFFSSATAA